MKYSIFFSMESVRGVGPHGRKVHQIISALGTFGDPRAPFIKGPAGGPRLPWGLWAPEPGAEVYNPYVGSLSRVHGTLLGPWIHQAPHMGIRAPLSPGIPAENYIWDQAQGATSTKKIEIKYCQYTNQIMINTIK